MRVPRLWRQAEACRLVAATLFLVTTSAGPAAPNAQADRLGLRQVIGRCTWATYDASFAEALREVASDGVTHVIFGDILFDEHRRWAERMCDEAALVVETVVTNSPLFRRPLELRANGSVQRADCWALDVVPYAVRD